MYGGDEKRKEKIKGRTFMQERIKGGTQLEDDKVELKLTVSMKRR